MTLCFQRSLLIIDSASNELDLRILESIYIHDRKPILNDKESAFNLQIIK